MTVIWHRKKKTHCDNDEMPRKTPVRRKRKKAGVISKKWGSLYRRFSRSIALLKLQVRRLGNALETLTGRVNAVQQQVDTLAGGRRAIIGLLNGRLNTTLTIETPGGTVFGTLITVGADHVQILEPTGAIVLLPIRNILTVS
ncbi:DUF2642 domain-containing protein [Paenibacillus sp. DMB20]|uniref:DUF2642 domain-containing protein n=1 Tax=Paenibacillus sp. DMB20 TaxID=1642570 RepID=UPI00069B8AB0|nr:DUF2642 domain-containing protein [Paenibacillus sp. DMB20]